MPLSEFQKHVLRLLVPQRTHESHVARGSPIAFHTSRYSGDFDIFMIERLVSVAALADATTAFSQSRMPRSTFDPVPSPRPRRITWPVPFVTDTCTI